MNKADWVAIIKKERKEASQVRPTLSNVFFGGTQHIAVAKQEVTIKETTKVTQNAKAHDEANKNCFCIANFRTPRFLQTSQLQSLCTILQVQGTSSPKLKY